MNVMVKMVTGDHASIAKEIAQQVNLGTEIKPASSFLDKPDREAKRIVEGADGFAQVFPEHKYHIVELLQESDHIIDIGRFLAHQQFSHRLQNEPFLFG